MKPQVASTSANNFIMLLVNLRCVLEPHVRQIDWSRDNLSPCLIALSRVQFARTARAAETYDAVMTED